MLEIDRYWFLGLIEGEGHFGICKTISKHNTYPTFRFVLEMKEDLDFFCSLKNNFGGSIYIRKKRPGMIVWKIGNVGDLLKLYDILKDLRWRTKKKKQFDWFYNKLFEYQRIELGEKKNWKKEIVTNTNLTFKE